MKNILTEALVNSATNASFIFSYTNSAKLRLQKKRLKRLTICLKSVTESDLIKIRKGFEVLYYVA